MRLLKVWMYLIVVIFTIKADVVDSIEIKGAKCKITIPDSASCFSSFERLCDKNYYFYLNKNSNFNYNADILVEFNTTSVCSLKIRDGWYGEKFYPVPCDSLKPMHWRQIVTVPTGKCKVLWEYALLVKAKASDINLFGTSLQFVLKSQKDSSLITLYKNYPFSKVIEFPSKRKTNSTTVNAYAINGKAITATNSSNSLFILHDNSTGHSSIQNGVVVNKIVRKR